MYTNPRFYSVLFSHGFKDRVGVFNRVFDSRKRVARFKHEDQGRNGNKSKFDTLLNTTNSQYLDQMYKSWLKDPKSVGPSWDSFFRLIQEEDSPPKTAAPKAAPNAAPARIESPPALVPANLTRQRNSGKFIQ